MDPIKLIEGLTQANKAYKLTITTEDVEITITKRNPSIAVVSPEMATDPPSSPNHQSPIVENDNNNDDIWASDDGHATTEELLSDLPAVRRKHLNDGYREGLSIGKARVMQEGFDEGYPIGVALGLRVGPILGVFEACLACKSINTSPELLEKVKAIHADALKVLNNLFLVTNYDEHSSSNPRSFLETNEELISYWENVATKVYDTRLKTLAIQEK